MSKISFHIQHPGIAQWLKDEIIRAQVDLIKVMHPEMYDGPPMAGTSYKGAYVGRFYFGQGEPDRELIYKGATGAQIWFDMVWPRLQKCRWCHIIEGPNEPLIDSVERAEQMVAFERRRTELLHGHGFLSASYCFSVANPKLELWPILGAGIGDYLDLHEYGQRAMTWDGDWLGRYRKVLPILEDYGYPEPRIIFGENGIDERGDPKTSGWRYHLQGNEDEYVRQLKASSIEWDKDDAVWSVHLFTHQDENWPSFAHNESVTRKIVDFVASEAEPADVGAMMLDLGQKYNIPLNWEAALLRAGTERGLAPISSEHTETIDGVQYVGQSFYDADDKEHQWGAHCKYGDWGNVIWTEGEN